MKINPSRFLPCQLVLESNRLPFGAMIVEEFIAICLEHSNCPIYGLYLSCQTRSLLMHRQPFDPGHSARTQPLLARQAGCYQRAHIEIMACRPQDTYKRNRVATAPMAHAPMFRVVCNSGVIKKNLSSWRKEKVDFVMFGDTYLADAREPLLSL